MKLKLLITFLFTIPVVSFAQIGIGTAVPNANSELDIVSPLNNKGVLLPRMTEAQRLAIPVTAADAGLLVYQTDIAPLGLWVFNGSIWIPNTSASWAITGNASINAATNFLGTTDAQPLAFRTNNVERMRILANGNVGINENNPTNLLHIRGANSFRYQDTFQLAGRLLTSDANGVARWANAPAASPGTGWTRTGNAGTSPIAPLNNFIGTTDAQDFVIRTNNTEALRVLTNGNVGIGTTTPTAKLDVTENEINLPIIRGQNTNNTAGSVSTGILGQAFATSLGSAGVLGVSTGGGNNEIGVLGDYALWGAAVYGQGSGAVIATDLNPARDYGVYGSVDSSVGTGVYGKTLSASATSFGMYCNGNFAVTGTKSASVPTSKGNQLVYCTESPELWFEDLGFGELQNGSVHIKLDDMFQETVYIDTTHKMHVFLQEEGESNGLFVTIDSDNKGFTVKEKNNGRSNSSFSYRILAKRRFYQNQRFGVDANQPFENNLVKHKDVPVTTTDPQEMKRFVDVEIAKKNIKSN